MSSFICSSKHFNSIQKKLVDLFLFSPDFSIPYKVGEAYKVRKFSHSAQIVKAEVKNIVDVLRRVNVLAVSMQYAKHYAGELDQHIQDQTAMIFEGNEYKELSTLGLYNAMRCTLYQIEVEHIKELRELATEETNALMFLDEMIDGLARHIISNLPEDKSNTWEVR